MINDYIIVLNSYTMVSAGNTDYLFGYYIWLLAHPELRGMILDSEYDFAETGIHAVNPYIGLDGDDDYLEASEIHMSRGGDVLPHYQLWNIMMNNIETLAPIFDAKFRCLMQEMTERYLDVTTNADHEVLPNDGEVVTRYQFLIGLNIQYTPIADEEELKTVNAYIKASERIVSELIMPHFRAFRANRMHH